MSRILRRCPHCKRWFVASSGRRGRPHVQCVECNPRHGGELEGNRHADGFLLRKCEDCGAPFETCNDSRRVCAACAAKRREQTQNQP